MRKSIILMLQLFTDRRLFLAACPGTYPVPAMGAGLPLPHRHSSTVPGLHSKPVYQRCCSLSSAFCWHSDVTTAVNSAYNTRRPSVLCCSGARLEQFAARDSKFRLVADIPTND